MSLGALRQSGKVSTRTVVGWAVFFLLLSVIGLFGYRVQYYYRHLKAGNIIELPSPNGRFSVGRVGSSQSPAVVSAEEVNSADAPSLGAPAGEDEFTVVMFGDYECAFSQESANTFRRIAVKYGDRVRFIYRDFPLPSIHPNAYRAALAAECAHEQRRYWEYFDRLYSPTADLSDTALARYAQEVGLDTVQFASCLADGRYDRRIVDDLAAAELLGLRGTPTFYIDGRKVEGMLEEKDFEQIISKLLQ
ncbi:MAG: thioredoxin domain-containing protein [Patescibacteria group bacterium]